MWHPASLKWIAPVVLGMSLLSTAPALAGAAFRLNPPRMTFAPSGSGATRSFQIESTGDQPVAVEIRMTKREVDLAGKETQPDAEEDFAVYPTQILLKPGELQTVRVTWLGDPNPSRELSYRIIAEQLPINLPVVQQTQNGVQINVKALYIYVGSVYITPAKVSPKVVVEQAVCQLGKDNSNELSLILNNQGTVHTYLTDLNLHVSPTNSDAKSAGNTVHLTPQQLPGINGENLLAGNKRHFTLPCPTGFPVGPVSINFKFTANQ